MRTRHTAERPGPSGTFRGACRGPQRRDRYFGLSAGGAGKHGPGGRRALQGGAPGARGARGRSPSPLSLPVLPPQGTEWGKQGPSPQPPPETTRPEPRPRSRSGEGGEGRDGGRAGAPATEVYKEEGPRAVAPASARKGSRAAAAGVGGGPAPVLAELTGGARFPVPRGVGDPGAVVAVTGGWRAAGRDGGGKGGTGGALALPRRPLLSVCVCSKMAARLVPRDTDAGPPPPTPPRPAAAPTATSLLDCDPPRPPPPTALHCSPQPNARFPPRHVTREPPPQPVT